MPATKADYAKYVPCRHCGSEDLELKSHPRGWKPKPGQSYYFTHWLQCQDCAAVYMLESCKRPVRKAKARPRRQKAKDSERLRLGVQPRQAKLLRQAAELSGLPLAGWARDRLLRAARDELR